ncbi:glycosyl hydrolase [Novosphingobium sp. M1R2S20]|uniref:Glycosyl hydrolase n=1 Tax=Novosphingobium rhizovicinum TaxID=3228928 RepID=A0ABV3RE80_9SPHN
MSGKVKYNLAAALLLLGAATYPAAAQPQQSARPEARPATVAVDFSKSRGELIRTERYNNVSRPTTFAEQRDADVEFLNEQGLHGQVYRVWIDAHIIHDEATGTYNYEPVLDYLGDLSRLSDNLLVVMDTRVAVRDRGATPAQIKPVVKTIMRELKQRFPNIRYIEAFNEPDHNLAKALKPEQLYAYYVPYYEAVNEINRELKPKIPLEIGGPGLMMYNEPWLRAFLSDYKADKSPEKRIDFISYHAYGEFPEGNADTNGPRAYHFYKGNPSEVANQRQRLEQEFARYGLDRKTPRLITELGIYPGPSFDNKDDPKPDYLIGAAGVPSLIYWFLDQPGTYPFNWVVRHKTEERKDQLVTRVGEGVPPPTDTFTPYGNTLKMMSKLKKERVAATSDALTDGQGVYSIATKDGTGAAIMVWNYQHTNAQNYRVNINMRDLPASLAGKPVRQQMFRIDAKTSNYWADPATANLQKVSETVVQPKALQNLTIDLPANALHLVVLEPAQSGAAAK